MNQPTIDVPKLLGVEAARAERRALLWLDHVAPLTAFVETLRTEVGEEFQIPDFDPWDGGVKAEILFLLEAPGPKAVRSGFISRNNPDETAKNFFLLNQEAGICGIAPSLGTLFLGISVVVSAYALRTEGMSLMVVAR
jgi:uracil-DNA glycosylase